MVALSVRQAGEVDEMSIKGRQRYQKCVAAGLTLLVLVMSYIALKEYDTAFLAISSDAGYIKEQQIVDGGCTVLAIGMEQVILYPQTYELTIDARTESDAFSFQVLDRWTHTLLAEHAYTPGEEYHTVRFTTDQTHRDVIVRSIYNGVKSDLDDSSATVETTWTGEKEDVLKIYGYTMKSDGKVGCDAKWDFCFLVLFLALVFFGGYRALHKGEFAVLFLSILSFGASLPFFGEYLPLGHDIRFHVSRILSLAFAIQEGQIPQRLTYTLGGSEIVPIMYPEILLIGAGSMVAAGATVFLAYKVTCIFITFLTAFLAYYAARSETNEKTALLFAAVYVLNPYRMNELFLRAAIGEALGVAFLPLVVVGMWQFFHEKEEQGTKLLFLGYTGLLSSHIVLTVISAFFCLVYVAAEFIAHPWRIRQRLWGFRKLLILGGILAAVNAWFLVPFLSFLGWESAISASTTPDWIQGTSPYLWQVFMGGSLYGDNKIDYSAKDEMSVTIGPALLLAMVVFVFAYLKDKGRDTQNNAAPTLEESEYSCGKWCLLFGLIALYLSSPYFPWTYLNENVTLWAKTMGSIQYSWRILTYASLFLSVLLVIVVCALFRTRTLVKSMIAGGMLLLVLLSGLDVATNYYSNPDYMCDRYDNELTTSYDYVIAEVARNHGNEIKAWIESGDGPRSTEEEGSLRIVNYRRDGVNYWFSYEKEEGEEVQVMMPVFWYGLHKAYWMDTTGSAVAGNSEEITTSMNEDNQFTVVTLPAGSTEGEVVLQYEEPLLFRIGNWISVVSVAGLVLVAVRRKVALPRKREAQV